MRERVIQVSTGTIDAIRRNEAQRTAVVIVAERPDKR